jgi:hypothetical protein
VSRLTLTQRFLKSQPVEIATLEHRIGTPATIPPARTACIDSFAHACDFFPSADCDAAGPRGDCGPASRDKDVIGGFPQAWLRLWLPIAIT